MDSKSPICSSGTHGADSRGTGANEAGGHRLRHAFLVATLTAFGLSACAGMSDTQRRTATGAGIGSAVGAVIGGTQSGGKGVRNGALIGGAAAGLGTYIWSSRMEEQKRAMEESTQGTGVQVTQTDENLLRLDIPSDISFDVNRAEVRSDFRPILDRFAQTLVSQPGRDGPDHRPYRQHRLRRHQQSAVGEPRRQHARLSDSPRRSALAHHDRRPRRLRSDRGQQFRGRQGAEPPRGDLCWRIDAGEHARALRRRV